MRVDKVLNYLDQPAATRPTMISMYFSTTDDVGHEFGPDAEETKYAVWEVDEYIERLMAGLAKRGIDKKVNIIIVSDHGMAAFDREECHLSRRRIRISKRSTERILWTNEIVQIFPKPGRTDEVYSKIRELKHATCWKKGEMPARLHYNNGRRIAPIVCSSGEGWITTTHKRWDEWYTDLDDVNRHPRSPRIRQPLPRQCRRRSSPTARRSREATSPSRSRMSRFIT